MKFDQVGSGSTVGPPPCCGYYDFADHDHFAVHFGNLPGSVHVLMCENKTAFMEFIAVCSFRISATYPVAAYCC